MKARPADGASHSGRSHLGPAVPRRCPGSPPSTAEATDRARAGAQKPARHKCDLGHTGSRSKGHRTGTPSEWGEELRSQSSPTRLPERAVPTPPPEDGGTPGRTPNRNPLTCDQSVSRQEALPWRSTSEKETEMQSGGTEKEPRQGDSPHGTGSPLRTIPLCPTQQVPHQTGGMQPAEPQLYISETPLHPQQPIRKAGNADATKARVRHREHLETQGAASVPLHIAVTLAVASDTCDWKGVGHAV